MSSLHSPWRVRDFRALFAATALSDLGTNIGYVAIPLIALEALDASPGQVGALAALGTVAFLLIGLPAGAWVDRMRRRRVLIVADLVRAALIVSIPVAWWLDVLTLPQLYAVVLLNGCATVFFDVGSQSFLPQLVGRDALLPANSVMVSLMATTNIAGRGAGGFLIQLVAAPAALVCTAVGYLASGLGLTRIRAHGGSATPAVPAAPAVPVAPERRLRAEIGEGLRHVTHSRELRALALTAACMNLGSQLVNTMIPVVIVRELDLSEGTLGLYFAVGGLGILAGARSARPLARRLGIGRTFGLLGPCLAPAALLIPLLDRGPWLWVAGVGWFLATAKVGTDNVLAVSLRQRLTPDALLGRMNATFRFVLTGASAVGAVLAALIGQFVGVHASIWAGAVCMTIAFLPVFCSPIRKLRELPDPLPIQVVAVGKTGRATADS
ncbi:MFS transporter [Embleya sp. NBC_00896]|uniref:MFS transporter n=1 Tax=Embleya sp. NBC_00896 TaxID=2975961 RepID=UPI002F906CCA|nr:MFS transporter [Embleya sp. NBC_00896]